MRPSSPTALLPSASLGSRIRAARQNRGLSQIALAKELGVGRRTVQSWESGENGITRENLAVLAAALELAEDDLRHLDGDQPDVAGAEQELLARVTSLESKIDVLLRLLGVDPAQATADGAGADVVTVSEAWIDGVVERMVAGFEQSAPALRAAGRRAQ